MTLHTSASMEPRSAERGNACPCCWRAVSACELQWSHAQLSVETRALDDHGVRRRRVLQWSHAQLSVETWSLPTAGSSMIKASMEPRSAERGNRQTLSNSGSASKASMEPRSAERGNLPASIRSNAARLLQWSHAQLSVETRGRGYPETQFQGCFNGATLS